MRWLPHTRRRIQRQIAQPPRGTTPMNNVFFLEAATKAAIPQTRFVGEPPLELMGFKPGDEKILLAPLDWVGFHFYTRRIISDASNSHASGGAFGGTEIESDSGGARDPYTGIRAANAPPRVR